MPTYQYQCTSCKDQFESFQSMSNYLKPTEEPCSKCAGQIEKIITSPMIVDPTKLMGMHKVDGDFRNILENVAKKVYKSDFNIR